MALVDTIPVKNQGKKRVAVIVASSPGQAWLVKKNANGVLEPTTSAEEAALDKNEASLLVQEIKDNLERVVQEFSKQEAATS